MKTQISLLALSLCGLSMANAQTTTNTYSSTATTNPSSNVTSQPATTNTNSMNSGNASTNNGSTANSTYSTNSLNSPSNNGTMATAYSTTDQPERVKGTKAYQSFVFGIYAGLNTTKFKGEAIDANGSNSKLTGRLGYQLGFFVRGGGRLYGQVGAEYFASSSDYFTKGSGQTVSNIKDQINIKYIQVPVYIGYKLVESDRGISAVRLQVGVEYANRIGSDAKQFGSLNNFQIKSGSFNGLGQLGFDMGPVFIDLTYHYGFSSAIQENTGFAGSQRRIASASFGFKF